MQVAQGQIVTVPNFITVARMALVPTIVWFIAAGQHTTAFWLFVCAGAGDAVDGYLARQFNLKSQLGAWLDPAADKALLVSAYVALAYLAAIPLWLTLLVVGRDIFIVAAVGLSWVLGKPVAMQPLFIGKANTVGQILLAAIVLGDLAFAVDLSALTRVLVIVVAILTVGSAVAYSAEWVRHMRGSTAR